MSSARDELLSRIRTALGESPRPALDVPRTYRTAGAAVAEASALLALLADRLVDYRAGVRTCAPADVADAVGEAVATGLARRAAGPPIGTPRVVIPLGLDRRWLDGVAADVVEDGTGSDALGVDALDVCDVVLTAATVAIAETGTIVLDGSTDQGRRAITLIPDVHVCVVTTAQVVATVPDAMPLLDATRPLTWISGASATSDIELDRVEGVHGPRILEVVLVDGGALHTT